VLKSRDPVALVRSWRPEVEVSSSAGVDHARGSYS